jgi:hypothetical protein
VPNVCDQCGTENAPDAIVCSQCGVGLSSLPEVDERARTEQNPLRDSTSERGPFECSAALLETPLYGGRELKRLGRAKVAPGPLGVRVDWDEGHLIARWEEIASARRRLGWGWPVSEHDRIYLCQELVSVPPDHDFAKSGRKFWCVRTLMLYDFTASDLESLASELERRARDLEGSEPALEALRTKIFEECKVVGRFTLDEGIALCRRFAGKWIKEEDAAAALVEDTIRRLILDGKLDGLFDPDSGVYTSSALLDRSGTQMSIDYSGIASLLKQKGLFVKAVKCPACGGKLPLPESGDVVRCEYCDTLVQATDVLDKLRDSLRL